VNIIEAGAEFVPHVVARINEQYRQSLELTRAW
jgi:hypothetical protein